MSLPTESFQTMNKRTKHLLYFELRKNFATSCFGFHVAQSKVQLCGKQLTEKH